MTESTPAPPPLPPASLSILALLVPFHPPLAPNILSTPLNTRHTFLPPNESEPDSYLSSTSRPSQSSDWAERNPIATKLEQLATSNARDDLHFGSVSYWRPDEATFLARARVVGFEDGAELSEQTVEVEWLWEGERDMGGRGWTLHSVDLSQALNGQGEWKAQPGVAWAALDRPSQVQAEEDDSDTEEGKAGNDFWSSYSSSPRQSHDETVPDTPQGDEDNSYWAAYGSVDDGLAGTQPTTPVLRNNMSFTHLKEQTWGTGGETPVGWSPQQQESPALVEDSAPSSPQRSVSGLSSQEEVQGSLLLSQATSADQEPEGEVTPPAGTVDLGTPAGTQQAQLVKILSGTWELWRSQTSDEQSARQAFRSAVDEVLRH